MTIGLEVSELMRKHGAEMCMARETQNNVRRVECREKTWNYENWAMILILYGAGADVDVETGLVLKW